MKKLIFLFCLVANIALAQISEFNTPEAKFSVIRQESGLEDLDYPLNVVRPATDAFVVHQDEDVSVVDTIESYLENIFMLTVYRGRRSQLNHQYDWGNGTLHSRVFLLNSAFSTHHCYLELSSDVINRAGNRQLKGYLRSNSNEAILGEIFISITF